MVTKREPLTLADMRRASSDDRWLGFGFLGVRRAEVDHPEWNLVNELVIDFANEREWDYEALFAWANSKNGRWFGDAMFGYSDDVRERFARAVGHGLMVVPTDA